MHREPHTDMASVKATYKKGREGTRIRGCAAKKGGKRGGVREELEGRTRDKGAGRSEGAQECWDSAARVGDIPPSLVP